MRLLADENIPLAAVRALRQAGHDVLSAAESAAGSSDQALAEVATATDRVILTFDRDFGALATTAPTAVPGVILLRVVPVSASHLAVLLRDLLLAVAEPDWRDHLSVVTADHVRRRKLVRAV
jgi:predicted nuclease of predicted toxin-antitoxin system